MSSGLKKYDVDPANLDADGIAENQTTAGAANLTLNGALCDLGTAGQFDVGDAYSAGVAGVMFDFVSVGDISGITFTITGKDQDGNSVTESVTGVTTTPVATTGYFSQITQIAADGAVASNVSVGTSTGGLVTRTVPVNSGSEMAVLLAASALSGTCQFDFQETYDDVLSNGTTSAVWFNVLSNQTTNVSASCTKGATAVRCKFDSYSNGAELQFHVNYNPVR